MIISIIAALSKNYIIGNHNKLPWYLPQDLKWFKKHTLNKSVIMGRITWESLPGALPMRQNIILSSQIKNTIYKNENTSIIWVTSFKKAIELVSNKKEIMIIGGGKTYSKTIKYANRLYLTHVNQHVYGDTYFPKYNINLWKRTFFKKHISNKYSFEILEKKSNEEKIFYYKN